MSHFRFRTFREDELHALARAMAESRPFPHVVIPDCIVDPPAAVLGGFPSADHPGWRRHSDAYEAHKMSFGDLEQMPEPLASMVHELSAAPFLQFLERVTGIKGLMPDPYLQGAGLHWSGANGVNAPHTDTHINERLAVFRRVNVLIYLNPGWVESNGGCFELYDPVDSSSPCRTVVPTWGTCLIFRSDARSVHGFSRPIAAGCVRRAIAVYYYTSLDASVFSGSFMTMWAQHEEYWDLVGAPTPARQARMHVYRTLRFGAKALSYLAHRMRPRI
ncbi:MAG TPA: 2OG-Fe(II) oxygenase [Candidatus Margulisiibacteriota bacterium]|nr:2OG-Fe(II) oxygenase [Candidatus Margulisiibacteriota bacterium]